MNKVKSEIAKDSVVNGYIISISMRNFVFRDLRILECVRIHRTTLIDIVVSRGFFHVFAMN